MFTFIGYKLEPIFSPKSPSKFKFKAFYRLLMVYTCIENKPRTL